MTHTRSARRLVALAASVVLVASACSSESAPPTAPPTSAPAATSSTTSSSTTTTVPPTSNGPAIAVQGDVNETVVALQFLINCNGFDQLTVDGAFGPATQAAVETVQVEYGREVTGAPDDETFAMLSRGCSDDRRVSIDGADEGEKIAVGNAAPDDPETFFIRADEGDRMSVVVEADGGAATVSVRSADGAALGPQVTRAWAVEVPATGDYVVEVNAKEPTTFAATFALVSFDSIDVDDAKDGKVVVDDLESSVTSVCLDTGGDGSYVAETSLGYLVVTTGRVGGFSANRGGIGAPVEFIFRDASPGYYGFGMDLDAEVGDQVVGTGVIFQRAPGHADEPLGVAFRFDRAVTPCEGSGGTSAILRADGLGIVDFGADPDETVAVVRAALIGASPSVDSDWVAIDNLSNSFGVCRAGTSEVRSVEIDNLTLYFTDAGTSFATEGTRHFASFVAVDGVFPFKTGQGVGPGDTIQQFLDAHLDAVAAPGITGGIDVYVSSAPGSDAWLRATAEDATSVTDTSATITSVTGGRFCDR